MNQPARSRTANSLSISALQPRCGWRPTTLEWENKAADNYYAAGTHTVRVRAKTLSDLFPWAEKTFTITSSAPVVTLTAAPTRTANNGKFLVDISATASDADGDATTLEWENKAADNYYAVGTHTIRVRAKDATGLYSQWVSKPLPSQTLRRLRRSLPERQAAIAYRRERQSPSKRPAPTRRRSCHSRLGAETQKHKPTRWKKCGSCQGGGFCGC